MAVGPLARPGAGAASHKGGVDVTASQANIDADTPMGATLVAGGTAFRVWAPHAIHVYVVGDGGALPPAADRELLKDPATGHWTGFFADIGAGSRYRYYIQGPDGSDLKRDPRARELDFAGPPDCDCIVTDPRSYPWHDDGARRRSSASR